MCNSTLLRTKQLRLRLNFCEVDDRDGLGGCSDFEASYMKKGAFCSEGPFYRLGSKVYAYSDRIIGYNKIKYMIDHNFSI